VRVLLDECTPRKLRRELPEHDVRTVTEMGWSGTKNGALLRKAAGEFDVMLTVDSNMEFQQSLHDLPLAVIVLVAFKNDVNVLRPLMPQVRELLPTIERGRLYRIGPAT
jgi:predicted nuclease of predicted toxin-antitoxin system